MVNLCRSYRYQSFDYYISLLAEARGHRPWPSAGTMEDLQPQKMVPVLTASLAPLIDQTLAATLDDDPGRLHAVYGELCECLHDNRQFPGRG